MQDYINEILAHYNIDEKYNVDQEYDPYDNVYYVSIYLTEVSKMGNDIISFLDDPKGILPEILLEHHEEFIFNLDRIIIRVYPDYIKNTLKVNYFGNKIWISFRPIILDLHIITINAVSTINEQGLKDLIGKIHHLSKNKFNVYHHIIYNYKKQHIKQFTFVGRNYKVIWHRNRLNDDLTYFLNRYDFKDDDVIMIVPQSSQIKTLPIEMYDLYENKIERLDIIGNQVYASKYLYLK